MTTIRVTDEATRAQIAEEIRDLRAEAGRLPFGHQRRVKMERRIDVLVDRWLAAGE